MPVPAELASFQEEMRPIGELHTGGQAHVFARGLVLAHFDAALCGGAEAAEFLRGDVPSKLAEKGIDAFVPG
jgi:hypothetical protein